MAASSVRMIGPKAIDKAERSELISLYDHYASMGNEWLRRQVIQHNRIDILAHHFLGFTVKPFHLAMMRWQFLHPDNLQLAFRGSGKTTTCTVAKAIHLLLKDPNLRILLASKTSTYAGSFLKEIKQHFEENQRLIEVFGPYYDPRKVTKWDSQEIEVLPRTKVTKEGSITCVGVEGMVVSKHYDIIISDDLIDEDNSRTKGQRDKTKTWYYKTLDPTLEPPDSEVPHRGEHHRLGTRYHYDDLYGHLEANELKSKTQTIPALNERGQSPWPEKFSPVFLAEKRRKSGIIIFNSQFQCNTEAMKGEIFQYDDCQIIPDSQLPGDMHIYMGVDLAISETDKNDKFAIVVIGVDGSKRYYVLDFYENQLRFGQQTNKIVEFYKRYKPIRAGIEINAYQKAQLHNLRDSVTSEVHGIDGVDLRLKGLITDKDKITRAWKLSALFEDKRMFFRDGQHLLIEHLVLFPNHKYKDLFDALDLAVRSSKVGKGRKRRSREPGLI